MKRVQTLPVKVAQYARKGFKYSAILFVFGFLFSLFSPVIPAQALSGITITPITIEAVIDSNNSCSATTPQSMFIEVRVNNTTASPISGLSATISNFTPASAPANYANTWGLDSGANPVKSIGTIPANSSVSLYWYVNYFCYSGVLNGNGIVLGYTVTVSNNTVPNYVYNGTMQLRGEKSAAAGGILFSQLVGAGAVLGQVIKTTMVYDFGNTGANTDINIQPTANTAFSGDCFELVGVDVTNLVGQWTGITTASDNLLRFSGVDAKNSTMTVDYYFKAVCTSSLGTLVLPFADLGSGTQYKYLGNYGSCGSTPCNQNIPAPSNPFTTITKTANPSRLAVGGTTTQYTVRISNTTAFDSYIDKITDLLPAGVSFGALVNGASCANGAANTAEVTTANSQSLPNNLDINTITFQAYPTVFNPLTGTTTGGYKVPAGYTLYLCYTANIPVTEQDYVNSVNVVVGNTTIGPATATVTVGKLTPTVTTTIHDASHNAITSVATGSTVHDSATVTGTGATPTGTVDFTWYTTLNCTGGSTAAGTGINLVAGTAHPSTSEGPLSAGSYSFKAHYNGDGNYKAADSVCEPLTVLAAPSIAKAFGAATIPLNGTSTLTITITNPNAGTALTGVAFTDSLPAGLTVASSSTSQCGGTLTTTSPSTISLAGGSIAAAGNCSFGVTVTGATAGAKTNTTGNVTSTNGGTGNTATDSTTVVAPPSIAKAFGAASIPLNGTTSLTFTITNPNAGTALTGVAFNDFLPAGLTVASSSTSQCGGTLTTTSPSTISLAGGSIAASGTCSFGVTVTGTTAGLNTNVTGNVASTNGGTGNTATDSTTVVAAPSIAKAFGAATIPLNGTTTLTFTITNPNAGTTLTGVAFTDSLPAGLTVTSGSSAQCGGTLTVTAPDSIALSGASIAASGTCTFGVTVTGTTVGAKTNTTGNVTSTNGGTGNTANAAITVNAPLEPMTGSKAFNPDVIKVGENVDMGIWLYGPSDVDLTSVSLTDHLPAGFIITNSSPAYVICTSGIIGNLTATTGSNVIYWTNGMINAGGLCRIDVFITATSAGSFTNVIDHILDVSNDQGRLLSSDLSAPITVNPATPTISTVLSNTSINIGSSVHDTATLTSATANAGGMVDYYYYTDNACSANQVLVGQVTVTNGVVPDSSSVTFNTAGTFYWQAVYSGDANNDTATSLCTSEQITVNKLSPSISTLLSSSSIPVGSSANDTATLTGATANAGGTVDYYYYTDNACSANQVLVGQVTVTNGVVPDSSSVTFNTAGTFYWQAVYSGDAGNNSATSLCNSEILTAGKASPTITTNASPNTGAVGTRNTFGDTATLTGGFNPTGVVYFNLYSDSGCTQPVLGMSGIGTISSGQASWSSPWIPSYVQTYYWQAGYPGDANNNSVTSGCSDANEQIVVGKVPATVATTIHDASNNGITSAYLGVTVHDSATVTSSIGLVTPSGTVYFTWYTNGTCTGTGTSGANIALDNGAADPSESRTPSSTGSYSFKAFYSGDSVFDPAESPCEPLIIQPAPAAAKSLTFTNQEGSNGSQVYVGEILTYQVTLTLYPGTVDNLRLVDTLDEGLAFVGCDSITFDTLDTGGNPCGSETVTAVGSNGEVDNGRQVEWNFGTIANKDTVPHTLTVIYRVVVLDSSANVRGKTLRNSAVWSWADVNNPTGPAVSLLPVQSTPVTIIEPSLAISKSISPTTVANGGQTTVTIVISHAPVSNADAFNMAWVDPLPANTEYVPGTISFAGLTPTTHDESNIYNLTAAWDVFPLGSTATIIFKIKVTLTGGISATNTTNISWTSLPGNIVEPQSTFNLLSTERFYDPQSLINIYGVSASAAINGKSGTNIPATGFTPGVVTPLSKQPAEMKYADPGNLYLDIPSLGQYMKIVGVPQIGNSWDITWLGRQAGYLQGTAFPTWNGNSVITAHVYDSNGYPGPFVNLASLKWGDKVIVHAYGTKYVYEVRDVLKTTSTDSSLLQHEDNPWVTLITCQGYNAKTGVYAWRIGVRAVLVQTLPDK